MSPSARLAQETKIEKVGVTEHECAFADFRCSKCGFEFVFDAFTDDDEKGAPAPKFCPNCGRRNA